MARGGTAPHSMATQIGCGWVDENALVNMLGEGFRTKWGPLKDARPPPDFERWGGSNSDFAPTDLK